MLELNSFSSLFKEIRVKYSTQSSLLRGFDAVILFSFLTFVIQVAYTAVTGAYPFESMISSICGSLGLMVGVLALRLHLTPEINSQVTQSRAFLEFLILMVVLFLFVWNIMF